MRKRLALLLSVLLILTAAFFWQRNVQSQDHPLRLIVVISVDQMRADYLSCFAPLYTGGLARLLLEGAVFSNAFYRHPSTETGPGHAVILTGKHGSHSGVVANGWYDSFLKADVNVVDDPLRTPVGGTGRGGSPANMLAITLPGSRKTGDRGILRRVPQDAVRG